MLAAFRSGDARVRRWLGAAGTTDPAAFARAFSWRGDRAALGVILDAAVAEADGGATAREAVARLRRDAVAIVAGQQPAVGGGPLYTLVKSAQAVATARTLNQAGIAASAVFWCASEDHDLGEADHADLIRRDGSIDRVRVALGGGRASLRFRPAAPAFAAVIERLRADHGDGLGATWLRAQAPRGDEGLGAWLCRLLSRAFASHGLIALEAHRLRPLWRTHLRRALDAWPRSALAEMRGEVIAAGHADALGALDQAPLFHDALLGRSALDPAAARALLASDPDALSPGAALRPTLQQAALPAACAVLGPGELAYHAVLGPVYAALDVPRPLPLPRSPVALAPGWLRRAAQAWDVDLATLSPGSTAPVMRPPLADELDRVDGALADLDRAGRAQPEDPARRVAAGRDRIARDLGRLRASLARGDRRRAGRPPFGVLTAWLFPRGEPQDRVLSLCQALWLYGPGLADTLVDAIAAAPAGDRLLVEV